MNDTDKNALMIALIAGSWTIVILMLLTSWGYILSIFLGLVVGGGAFFARRVMG